MSSLLFGNGTDTVHWKPNCNTRGTFDILSSCLITLFLCAWTAVNLNVPPPGSHWYQRLLRKVEWLILALLAPEVITYTAWSVCFVGSPFDLCLLKLLCTVGVQFANKSRCQRLDAISIMQNANKAYKLPNPPSWTESVRKGIRKAFSRDKESVNADLESTITSFVNERHSWTMTHGFYAMMGGFAIHIPKNLSKSDKFLPSNKDEFWFVTVNGIRTLLSHNKDCDKIPNLSEEEIKSKSKANGFTKTLVCVQAVWFIAQCLTRRKWS